MNIVHEYDLTPGLVPILFQPEPSYLAERIAMLKRNSKGSSKSKDPVGSDLEQANSAKKKIKKQSGISDGVGQTGSVKKKAKKQPEVLADVPVDGPVPEASVEVVVSSGGSAVAEPNKSTRKKRGGGDFKMTISEAAPTMAEMRTPTWSFSPLPQQTLFTPNTTNDLLRSLCGIADEIPSQTITAGGLLENLESANLNSHPSSSGCSCSTASCSVCNGQVTDAAIVDVMEQGVVTADAEPNGPAVLPTTTSDVEPVAVMPSDGLGTAEERTWDDSGFFVEGYRVLKKHYAMIGPSRVAGFCRFCSLAKSACQACHERFLNKMVARCGKGDSAFEKFERKLLADQMEALQRKPSQVTPPCVYCNLSQSMCAGCWERFCGLEFCK